MLPPRGFLFFLFTAIAELLIAVASFELAITRSPQRMKALVFAIVLFTSAISSAIGIIITPSLVDPDLIKPFIGVGVVNAVVGCYVWYAFRHMDDERGSVRFSLSVFFLFSLSINSFFPLSNPHVSCVMMHPFVSPIHQVTSIGTDRPIEGIIRPQDHQLSRSSRA